jgi:Holliday junction resolvase RusA-like endonuclease
VAGERVSLRIAGIPAPKGSRTVGTRKNGTHYTRESSEGVKSWVEAVAYSARANRPKGKPLEPPYEIELVFSMPRPAAPKYDWPSKDGDIDKLVRGVLDGMVQGGLLVDDRHVTALTARKEFSGPAAAGVAVCVL